jgi:uncharacterized membrane protein
MTDRDTAPGRFWLWVPVFLAGGGIVVAGYLTVKRFTGGALACTRWAQCDVVNTSPYAKIAGVPVAFIGLAGYLLLLGLALATIQTGGARRRQLLLASFVLSVGGTLFSIYLTYLEIYVIEALCSWCVASAVVILLLAVVGGLNLRSGSSARPLGYSRA